MCAFITPGAPPPPSALKFGTSKCARFCTFLAKLPQMCRILHIMTDIIEIAEQIRAARKQRKMTQAQLADAAHVSRRSVIELEAGRSPDPGFISVIRILMAVGLDLRITQATSRRPTYEDILAEQQER